MRTITAILGARPQFIKLAPVAGALRAAKIKLQIIHTGQHYDNGMSKVFFRQLGIPTPTFHLGIHGGTHGQQTGRMLEKVEEVIASHRPNMVLVFGDTNSTLSGALAAVKLKLPIAHVEAGMRSYNWEMPEEVNRLVTDHLATLHFCATKTAVQNLKREGITKNVFMVGDVMADLLLQSLRRLPLSPLKRKLNLQPRHFLLLTLHRASNADSADNLNSIVTILGQTTERVVFPLHPRTEERLKELGLLTALKKLRHVSIIKPVGYFDMLWLERNARMILTDSGGVQKEAYMVGVPCITLRQETEWVETLKHGWNVLTGVDVEAVRQALLRPRPSAVRTNLFGRGLASHHIGTAIKKFLQ